MPSTELDYASRYLQDEPTWKQTPRWQRIFCTLLFLVLAGIVGVSGLAWPMGQGQLSWWPWNQSWFMFYRSTGYHYYMYAEGTLVSDQPAVLSLEDYFQFPSAFHSPRFNEISRNDLSVRKLGGYLCKKFNQHRAAEVRLKTLTIIDNWWPDKRGVRRTIDDVPSEEKKSHTYFEKEPCDRLEAEADL